MGAMLCKFGDDANKHPNRDVLMMKVSPLKEDACSSGKHDSSHPVVHTYVLVIQQHHHHHCLLARQMCE